MNKVILKGYVGKDPTFNNVGDTPVANFSFATTERYKNRNGQKVEKTEWHQLAAWGPKAGLVEAYIRKGSELLIEGTIQYRDDKKETTSSGYPVKRTTIRVDQLHFCGRAPESSSATTTPADEQGDTSFPPEDDLPH